MKTKQLFISLILGLGLTLTLLWLLSGGTPFAHADSPHRVAPDCTGIPAPCHTTIQEAVDAAIPRDEIRVAAGTYTDVHVRPRNDITTTGVVTQVVYIEKSITIRGGYTTTDWQTPYPITQPTTLDAQGQGRVLYITGNIDPTIEGLRITGGNADGLGGGEEDTDAGGGVYINDATPILGNCQVFSNTVNSRGGGLYLRHSGATLSGNTVISNTAGEYGGGLRLWHSDATLSGNNIISNTAGQYGGGLALYSSGALLSGNDIISNTAHDSGGGLYLSSSGAATLSGNTVTANTAYDKGGGLYLTSSPAALSGNTIISNTASEYGGGLYLYTSTATLRDNNVISNTAREGGGLYLASSAAELSENTVISNTASECGGGLRLYSSPATLRDNSVISNTAQDGGGLYLSSSAVTLTGNTVTANNASEYGGGLRLYSSPATLSKNTITANFAQQGGGVYLSSSPATLSGNTITANTAPYGGGLYLYTSPATLSGDTVTANTTGIAGNKGGGLYLSSSDAILTNIVIADNQASIAGSGLYIEHSSPHLLHTTIARNRDSSGIYVTNEGSSYSTVALTNTILVSHAVGIYVTVGNTTTLECTLWGTDAWANDTDWGGAGTIITGTCNYWGDPAFVDPDAGDYHIGFGSAAIDRGVNADVDDDIDGDPRPIGNPDIGADELPKVLLPIVGKRYCSPESYEPNDSCNDARGPLTSGQIYQSWISYCDLTTKKSDYFYIDISTTNTINIYLTNIPAGTDYDLYLYKDPCDGPGNPVAMSRNYGNSPETISYSPPVAGTYYIRVYSYSGYSTSPYSLQVTYD